jgi:hypothetical protein
MAWDPCSLDLVGHDRNLRDIFSGMDQQHVRTIGGRRFLTAELAVRLKAVASTR